MHLRPLYYKIDHYDILFLSPSLFPAFEILFIWTIIESDFHDSEHIYPLSARTQRLKNMPLDGSGKKIQADTGDNCFNGQLMVLRDNRKSSRF
ncbi:hypothetical protein CEXT_8691 [Caerostris extrusa]|uniref:Uncharacterized protein n=1 Tax=Caerostris extrusa TaxID=172846 RepID=A0AAV4M3B0_CAEEX|nr:hypothetical protein CEXT_8691 [Caerostris extrusa]